MRVRWAVPCTASRSDGIPCRAWSIEGGLVCWHHGGAAPQVAAAAARRWERELLSRRIERQLERETGKPLDPMARAMIRFQASGDPATLRRHRRTADATA